MRDLHHRDVRKRVGERPARGQDRPTSEGLNQRQRRFIELFLAGNSATQAAVGAGYAEGSAHVTGSRLLRIAKVQLAIDERVQVDPLVWARQECQQSWTRIVVAAPPYENTRMSDRLRASELLARSQGLFVTRIDHDGSSTLEEILAASWEVQTDAADSR